MKRVRRELQSVLAERQVKSNKFIGDNNNLIFLLVYQMLVKATRLLLYLELISDYFFNRDGGSSG